MGSDVLKVRMLGHCSLTLGKREISDKENRSRKAWQLLAYMIYFRHRTIPQEELLSLLWGKDRKSTQPANALKTMLHRIRDMLDTLCENAGRQLIVRRDGTYAWNNSFPLQLDVEDFETLCHLGAAEESGDERLAEYRHALALYGGDFLPKFSAEPWVVSISTNLHSLYIQACRETIVLLERRNLTEEVIALCQRTVQLEPYEENFYFHLMKGLMKKGNRREAADVYRKMRDLLFSNFGIMPSDEVTALYRDTVRPLNDREITIDTVRDQLRETAPDCGALICDYDMFKVVYRMLARSVMRSGDAIHIALLTVSGAEDVLAKRSRDICMHNLLELLRQNLRRGDVISRCSISQYIVLLQQADYENSCTIMERISRSFCRRYPHSPARLHYSIQPIEPCQ